MMQPDSFSTITQALGFSVVHSLWQIALIWLIFKAMTWRLQQRNNAVYLLALAAMLTSAVWSAATFAIQYRLLSAEAEAAFFEKNLPLELAFETAASSFHATEPASQSLLTIVQNWLERHSAPVGWAWLLCASLLWLRLLGGWWLAQRLRRQGVSEPDKSFENLCDDWAKKLKIRQKVALLESSRISEPLTLGFLKPVVLFPIGMLAQLSPAQVEALLLHELAHIRRHDYLVNLLQLALEVCFFYHPLFWLLSREARTRREFCCDDVVLRYTPNPLLYAKTLTDLQLSFVHTQNNFAMNATGKSHFTERILRIAGITPKRSLRSNWLVLLLLPLLAVFISPWSSAQTPAPNNNATVEIPTPKPIIRRDTFPPRKAIRSRIEKPQQNQVIEQVVPEQYTPEPEALKVNVDSKSVAIEVVKMNVFYIGVDNPLRVAVEGVPVSEIVVELVGPGELTGKNGNYNVRVTEPGEVRVRVSRFVGDKREFAFEQKYRVKLIPDPVPKLGGKYLSQTISLKTLKEMRGIEAVLENFLLDATCEVIGYELTIVPSKKDPVAFNAAGSQFPQMAMEAFEMLDTIGGAVFMDDIRVKCPGDATPRNIGGLAFKVKSLE